MSKVLKGAGILAVCALIAKLIGAFYRVPLTNVIGSRGIGLYQMIFPLYTVLLTVSSGGLPVAVSRVVAGKIANGDEKGARKVLAVSLASLITAGLAAGVIIVIFRNQIASVQGNPDAALPYLGIAPSVVFVAVISCFRGYYQGRQNMLPSAISQLTEQAVKLVAGLVLARLMLPYGVAYGVLGALLGVSFSELITMLILTLQYALTRAKEKKRAKISVLAPITEAAADAAFSQNAAAISDVPHSSETAGASKRAGRRGILGEIYRIAVPVTLGSLVMPLTQVIDSILVINILTAGGAARDAATGAYGLLTGPVATLLNMPVVISLSFAVALLPKVSACFIKDKPFLEPVEQSFRYNMILGLLAAAALAVFAKPVLTALYSGGLTSDELNAGAALLRLGSVSVLYVSLLQVATSVLQATNRAHVPAVNLLYGAIVKVLLTLLLLPKFKLTGAMAASVACYGVTCVLDIRSMLKTVPVRLKVKEFFLGPAVAAAAFAGVSILLQKLLASVLPDVAGILISFFAALIIYILILVLFKSVKASEFADFPVVRGIIKRRRARAQQK
jgi:stage V sporulation protein B